MPWMKEAVDLFRGAVPLGVRNKRQLLRLISHVDRRLPISLPWCGLFVGHCLEAALSEPDLPRRHLRGRSWRDWGEAVPPQLGAIMVLWHLHPVSPFGHVAFYMAEDDDGFHLLGANQHDRITVQRYPRERLLAARWPAGLPCPEVTRRAAPSQAAPFT